MFEYAISNGAGTLLGYGTTDTVGILDLQSFATCNGYAMIFGPAASDCETGK